MKRFFLNIGIVICFTISLLAIQSCNKSTSSEISEGEVDLRGDVYKMSEDFDGYKCVSVFNDTMIFTSYSKQDVFSVGIVEGDSIRMYGHLLTVGSGPEESKYGNFCRDNKGEALILAGNYSDIKFFRGAVADNIRNWERTTLDKMSSYNYIDNPFQPLSDSTLLLIGAPWKAQNSLFGVLNLNTKSIEQLDYWPEENSQYSDMVKHIIYSIFSKLLTDGKGHFLYSSENGYKTFIFTVDGNHVNITKSLVDEPMEISLWSDGINYNLKPKLRKYWFDASDKYIYALVREKNTKGEKKEDQNVSTSGNLLLRYDWDGNLLSSYNLDYLGVDVNVDRATEDVWIKCYDESNIEEPYLVRYRL